MLQLEKEVDILMAQVSAGAPITDSKALLHDIAVGPRTNAASRMPAEWCFRLFRLSQVPRGIARICKCQSGSHGCVAIGMLQACSARCMVTDT